MTKKLSAIHPFPARMAPDTLSEWIEDLSPGSVVLDPMCGSGVVIRQSVMAGHHAIGFDIDPLAVLMSRVWTRRANVTDAFDHAVEVCEQAKSLRLREISLPWIDLCDETADFTKYWFAPVQRNALRKIAYVLTCRAHTRSTALNELLWLALSRTIVTKYAGASLAWDVSHSRPHKVLKKNEFDVFRGFARAARFITTNLSIEDLAKSGRVYEGDCRRLKRIRPNSVDAIFSSPPYLNAIDYLRGHKFSLVWMGYTIPELRRLRSDSIGAERAPDDDFFEDVWESVFEQMPAIGLLAQRQQRIVARYISDAFNLLREFRRVLKPKARMALVLGDSLIRGRYIENSKIYDRLATRLDFVKTEERRRPIKATKRYLPNISSTNTLENRMRHEIIQIYHA